MAAVITNPDTDGFIQFRGRERRQQEKERLAEEKRQEDLLLAKIMEDPHFAENRNAFVAREMAEDTARYRSLQESEAERRAARHLEAKKNKKRKLMQEDQESDVVAARKVRLEKEDRESEEILIKMRKDLERKTKMWEECYAESCLSAENDKPEGAYSAEFVEEELDAKERHTVTLLYDDQSEYDVIPHPAGAYYDFYPKLPRFHFVLEEPFPARSTTAIQKYTGDQAYKRLNLCLNLLNKASDPVLFRDLMEVTLGSFQKNLPDIVYRCQTTSWGEKQAYADQVGKKIVLKAFLSTSTAKQTHFGDTVFEIQLLPKRRNGAFYIGALSMYPHEDEVLLCAYSCYLVTSCKDNVVRLTYCDYYEYDLSNPYSPD